MTGPQQEPGSPRPEAGPGTEAGAPAANDPLAGEPIIPDQSPEDTDAGWGEYRDRDDDRLHRDRPPHWENL